MTLADRLRNAFLDAAQAFPHRTIVGEDQTPYLTRYVLGEVAGCTVQIHHFHRGDQDEQCHDHPWAWAVSLMLAGGYTETRLGRFGYLWQRAVRPGMINTIGADTFHRVDLIDEARGALTLFVTGPKVKGWGFRNHATGVVTPWRERLRQRGIGLP